MTRGFQVMRLRELMVRIPAIWWVACLLIVIRLAAGFFCYTCFLDFETPQTRSFHLHAGGDQNPCHHGRVEATPLIQWACTVTQDDTAYILPEIPRLPVLVWLFVPVVFLAISYADRLPIIAHGRGPPRISS
ncbi:MAG: hypothetical protein JSS38_08485 [Nitrospira sp.]|nr:hypothetical protein [Nitrospira sp.]MBS0154614.1 hypothetical protein [Nitrospira sp.]